jgi:hypothetical protein
MRQAQGGGGLGRKSREWEWDKAGAWKGLRSLKSREHAKEKLVKEPCRVQLVR